MSWKGAHLDGGWICTLCNWRQTQGAPDILASRVHWCNNCRKNRPSLWSQTSGPHFLQRLLQAELFKQHSPRQQCWRSSSCGPTVSAIPPGWFGKLQYQLHWPVASPITKTEKEQSWWQHDHQDVRGTHAHHEHQVAASSAAEENTAQIQPSLLWCTASGRLDTEHRNFFSSDSKAGTPGHQRNMLSSLTIRTCMVL